MKSFCDKSTTWFEISRKKCKFRIANNLLQWMFKATGLSQIAKFMGPTWGPPGSCRPQVGLILALWTLLSGYICATFDISPTVSSVEMLLTWLTIVLLSGFASLLEAISLIPSWVPNQWSVKSMLCWDQGRKQQNVPEPWFNIKDAILEVIEIPLWI